MPRRRRRLVPPSQTQTPRRRSPISRRPGGAPPQDEQSTASLDGTCTRWHGAVAVLEDEIRKSVSVLRDSYAWASLLLSCEASACELRNSGVFVHWSGAAAAGRAATKEPSVGNQMSAGSVAQRGPLFAAVQCHGNGKGKANVAKYRGTGSNRANERSAVDSSVVGACAACSNGGGRKEDRCGLQKSGPCLSFKEVLEGSCSMQESLLWEIRAQLSWCHRMVAVALGCSTISMVSTVPSEVVPGYAGLMQWTTACNRQLWGQWDDALSHHLFVSQQCSDLA
eukprot:TRINITY_DN36025_c0_g1_i2.p1 TRINITY_DN36025_c0_g1~~TRINITY_DN36025_c0_g1_i2.p1  ORF type:complete len:281 (+),score=11.96 TRINITY_DN36025_c0_g1_i2:131-973(+)